MNEYQPKVTHHLKDERVFTISKIFNHVPHVEAFNIPLHVKYLTYVPRHCVKNSAWDDEYADYKGEHL